MKSYRYCKCGNRTKGSYCSLKCLLEFKYSYDMEANKQDFIDLVKASTSVNQVSISTGLPRDRVKSLIEFYGISLKPLICLSCGKKLEKNKKDKCYCDRVCKLNSCKYREYPSVKAICSKKCINSSFKKTSLKQFCCFCGKEFIGSSKGQYKTCSYQCLVKLSEVIYKDWSRGNGKKS